MTPPEQFLNFGIGFTAPKARRNVHERNVGGGQPKTQRKPANNQFRDENFRALPGTAEFHHVQATLLRIHHGGQRSALAQRLDVPRRRVTWNHQDSPVSVSRRSP